MPRKPANNAFQLVVHLPKSDGMLTEDDHHLAVVARDEVRAALWSPPFENFKVEIKQVPPRPSDLRD